MSTRPCPPMRRRAEIFLLLGCRRSSIRPHVQQFTSNGIGERDSVEAHLAAGNGAAGVFPRAESAGHGAELSSAVDGADNTTQAGVRYMRSLGATHPAWFWRAGRFGRRRTQNASESGPAAEHQLQLQLGPLRLRTTSTSFRNWAARRRSDSNSCRPDTRWAITS